ncbi:cysteine and glycine-rich protein 2 binding protein [Anaeramoeba flamelloides]|uniref:Cysteine and glycine-rich protein 2 binding protein n=1 Tax=Anaeramoeba flamelloides TaxID=1746091 RepID=A0ABQ8XAE0_9EUKA|nr:cysteine and glycine-rich protein 2 binding protein [Anaeramoeba flamelloides]
MSVQQTKSKLKDLLIELSDDELFEKEEEINFSDGSFEISSDNELSDNEIEVAVDDFDIDIDIDIDLDEDFDQDFEDELGFVSPNQNNKQQEINFLFQEVELLKNKIQDTKQEEKQKEQQKWEEIEKLKKDNILLQKRLDEMAKKKRTKKKSTTKNTTPTNRSFSTSRMLRFNRKPLTRPINPKKTTKPLKIKRTKTTQVRGRGRGRVKILKKNKGSGSGRGRGRGRGRGSTKKVTVPLKMKRRGTTTGVTKRPNVNSLEKGQTKKITKKRILSVRKHTNKTNNEKLQGSGRLRGRGRGRGRGRVRESGSGRGRGRGRARGRGRGRGKKKENNSKTINQRPRSSSMSAYGKFANNLRKKNTLQMANQKKTITAKKNNGKKKAVIQKKSKNLKKKLNVKIENNNSKTNKNQTNKNNHDVQEDGKIISIWKIFENDAIEVPVKEIAGIQQLESERCYLIQTNANLFMWNGSESTGRSRIKARKYSNTLLKTRPELKDKEVVRQMDGTEEISFLKLFMNGMDSNIVIKRKNRSIPDSPDINKLRKQLENIQKMNHSTIKNRKKAPLSSLMITNNNDDDNDDDNDNDNDNGNDNDNDNGNDNDNDNDDTLIIKPFNEKKIETFVGTQFEIDLLNSEKEFVCKGTITINENKLYFKTPSLVFLLKGIKGTNLLLHPKFEKMLCLKIKSKIKIIFQVDVTEIRKQIAEKYQKLPTNPTVLYTSNKISEKTGEIILSEIKTNENNSSNSNSGSDSDSDSDSNSDQLEDQGEKNENNEEEQQEENEQQQEENEEKNEEENEEEKEEEQQRELEQEEQQEQEQEQEEQEENEEQENKKMKEEKEEEQQRELEQEEQQEQDDNEHKEQKEKEEEENKKKKEENFKNENENEEKSSSNSGLNINLQNENENESEKIKESKSESDSNTEENSQEK